MMMPRDRLHDKVLSCHVSATPAVSIRLDSIYNPIPCDLTCMGKLVTCVHWCVCNSEK